MPQAGEWATVPDGERAWTWGHPRAGQGMARQPEVMGEGEWGLAGRVLGMAEQQGRRSPEPHTSARGALPRPTPRLTKTCHPASPCLSLPPKSLGEEGLHARA